jgi:hypothetical protein
MIKIGWLLQYQVFGLSFEHLPASCTVADGADRNRPGRAVRCTFTSGPQVVAGTGQLPNLAEGTIPAGDWQIAITPPPTAFISPSLWLTVHATDEIDVGKDLEDAWSNDRRGRDQILSNAEALLEGELRPRAELVAGIWSAILGPKIFASPTSSATIWTKDETWLYRSARLVSGVVGLDRIAETQFQEQARVVSTNTYMPPRGTIEILRRASTWYLRAKTEAADSMEQFVWFFLSLEALTYLVDQSAEREVLENYTKLRSVVEQHALELSPFVASLGGRVGQAPLALRFRRLSEAYSGKTADDDVAAFAAFAATRNKLLHGDLAASGSFTETLTLNYRIGSLALRYLQAVIDARHHRGSSST